MQQQQSFPLVSRHGSGAGENAHTVLGAGSSSSSSSSGSDVGGGFKASLPPIIETALSPAPGSSSTSTASVSVSSEGTSRMSHRDLALLIAQLAQKAKASEAAVKALVAERDKDREEKERLHHETRILKKGVIILQRQREEYQERVRALDSSVTLLKEENARISRENQTFRAIYLAHQQQLQQQQLLQQQQRGGGGGGGGGFGGPGDDYYGGGGFGGGGGGGHFFGGGGDGLA